MGGGCAKLKRWLSGMRLAARAWEEDFRCHLEEAGMVRDNVPHSGGWNSMRGSWRRFHIRVETCSG